MAPEKPLPWSLSARWVFPVDGVPIENGLVVIQGDRIVAVEKHGAREPEQDFGDCAVLPGLVNAHTHLDLSGLRGLAPPSSDFTAWLRSVIVHRRSRTLENVRTDIREGLAECLRFGTTLLGDISGDGSSWDALAEAPVRAVVFRELLGLPPNRAAVAVSSAGDWLSSRHATPTCRPGLSPHAPYSVSETLFHEVGRIASIGGCEPNTTQHIPIPIAVHLAETKAELELLERKSGPFVSFLNELGVWAPEELVANSQRVMNLCDRGIPQLYVHANFLAASSRVPSRSTIVYCPRTHAAFGHRPHAFRDFLSLGVRVALGTDSLASNPDLDLLAEARFVHRLYPDFPGDRLLHMATLAGAEALGWADETGSLAPGKSADLVVLPISDTSSDDPYRWILQSCNASSDRRVMFRGRWVSGEDEISSR